MNFENFNLAWYGQVEVKWHNDAMAAVKSLRPTPIIL